VSADEGLELRHDPATLTLRTMERLAAERGLPEKQRKVLVEALAFARDRDAASRNREGWRSVLREKQAEVERLRANARAVGQGASDDIAARMLAIEEESRAVLRYVASFNTKAKMLEGRRIRALQRL
jgi:hypothetical protein